MSFKVYIPKPIKFTTLKLLFSSLENENYTIDMSSLVSDENKSIDTTSVKNINQNIKNETLNNSNEYNDSLEFSSENDDKNNDLTFNYDF